MLNVYVIGCGGIGGYLVNHLPMVISSLSLDVLESKIGTDISEFLENAGNVALPCIVDRLTLVDGDVFNPRNALRQGEGAGSKLVKRMRAIHRAVASMEESAKAAGTALEICKLVDTLASKDKANLDGLERKLLELTGDWNGFTAEDHARITREMLRVSFLRRMDVVGYNKYVNPDNLAEIIPLVPKPNPANSTAGELFSTVSGILNPARNVAVVFICVDNIQTRYDLFKYMERFDDCLVLNGGNSKTTGHVTVYERSGGKELDPPVYEVYPDIRPGVDKRPDELECTAVAPKHDQIAVTNSIVADVMLSRFVLWARKGLDTETRNGWTRYNDILIDTEKPSLLPVNHPVSSNNNTNQGE